MSYLSDHNNPRLIIFCCYSLCKHIEYKEFAMSVTASDTPEQSASATFTFLPSEIITNPDRFVKLYQLGSVQVSSLIEQETVKILSIALAQGDPCQEIDTETYFSHFAASVWPIIKTNKQAKHWIFNILQNLTKEGQFNSFTAELYLVMSPKYLPEYIRNLKNRNDAKDWLMRRPELLYEWFSST